MGETEAQPGLSAGLKACGCLTVLQLGEATVFPEEMRDEAAGLEKWDGVGAK